MLKKHLLETYENLIRNIVWFVCEVFASLWKVFKIWERPFRDLRKPSKKNNLRKPNYKTLPTTTQNVSTNYKQSITKQILNNTENYEKNKTNNYRQSTTKQLLNSIENYENIKQTTTNKTQNNQQNHKILQQTTKQYRKLWKKIKQLQAKHKTIKKTNKTLQKTTNNYKTKGVLCFRTPGDRTLRPLAGFAPYQAMRILMMFGLITPWTN